MIDPKLTVDLLSKTEDIAFAEFFETTIVSHVIKVTGNPFRSVAILAITKGSRSVARRKNVQSWFLHLAMRLSDHVGRNRQR